MEEDEKESAEQGPLKLVGKVVIVIVRDPIAGCLMGIDMRQNLHLAGRVLREPCAT